jgi:hypothetical protein
VNRPPRQALRLRSSCGQSEYVRRSVESHRSFGLSVARASSTPKHRSFTEKISLRFGSWSDRKAERCVEVDQVSVIRRRWCSTSWNFPRTSSGSQMT